MATSPGPGTGAGTSVTTGAASFPVTTTARILFPRFS